MVDRALHPQQAGDFVRDLARDGAEQRVEEKGRGGRVHQVLCCPRRADAELPGLHQFPEPTVCRQASRRRGPGSASGVVGATRADHRNREGVAEAARLLEGLHDHVLGHREGAQQPGDANGLSEPGGYGSARRHDPGGGLSIGWRTPRSRRTSPEAGVSAGR